MEQALISIYISGLAFGWSIEAKDEAAPSACVYMQTVFRSSARATFFTSTRVRVIEATRTLICRNAQHIRIFPRTRSHVLRFLAQLLRTIMSTISAHS